MRLLVACPVRLFPTCGDCAEGICGRTHALVKWLRDHAVHGALHACHRIATWQTHTVLSPFRAHGSWSCPHGVHAWRAKSSLNRLTDISRIMLYPALFLLAVGIFTGAVWANVSWGRYWGGDPKKHGH